jgi:ornithine carbamoyltransferase
MKDLLKTENLSRADFEKVLATAALFAENPLAHSSHLAHESVAVYMTKPSTRTRIASETAVAHLGGTPIFIRGDELQIGRGETIADTARIISGYCKALIIRTFAQSDIDELGKWGSIPVINGLSDIDHPTQLLADWVTIREVFGKEISGRKFSYLGDGNNMAYAWAIAGAIMGAHTVIATPPGKWALPNDAITLASQIAADHGGSIEVTHNPQEAAKNASVLYTDVWMSMGDSEDLRAEKLAALAPFAVTEQLMSLAASDSIFMHCLPAHRGEEVEAAVIDGKRSVIWREAFHRRTTIQALLFHLTKGDLEGSGL